MSFDAGVGGGEVPVERRAAIIALRLPCRDFAAHLCDCEDAPVQALFAQRAQFNLGDVQPASMFGRIVDFKFPRQSPSLDGRKGFVERCHVVRVEVVHCQPHFRRLRMAFVEYRILQNAQSPAACVAR